MLDIINRLTVMEFISLAGLGFATTIGLKFATYPTLAIIAFAVTSMMLYKLFF